MFLKRSTPQVSQAIRKKSGYLYFMLFNVRLWLLVVKYPRLSRLFLHQNAPQTSEVTLCLSLPLSQRDLNAPGPFQVQPPLQAFICKTPLEVHVYRSWGGAPRPPHPSPLLMLGQLWLVWTLVRTGTQITGHSSLLPLGFPALLVTAGTAWPFL